MPNTIYFVRHGESFVNLTKEFSYNKVDLQLTPKGCLQAEQTGAYFQEKGITAIFSSPLKRAMETAGLIAEALGLEAVEVEQFREMNVGSLEGHPDLRQAWAEAGLVWTAWLSGDAERAFPDGENLIALQSRFLSGLSLVLSGLEGGAAGGAVGGPMSGRILIVTHGGILTASVCALCPGLTFEKLRQMSRESHNCSITEVEVDRQDGRWEGRLIRWADFSHLHGEAARVVSGSLETE